MSSDKLLFCLNNGLAFNTGASIYEAFTLKRSPIVSTTRSTYKLSIEPLGSNPSLFTNPFHHPKHSAPGQSLRSLSELGLHL
jgi:hypothetical protein